jgi:hypothetical protein
LALKADFERGLWLIVGSASEHKISKQRAEILEVLKRTGPLRPKAIAELLNKPPGSVRALLLDMKVDGQVRPDNSGKYSVTLDSNTSNVVTSQPKEILSDIPTATELAVSYLKKEPCAPIRSIFRSPCSSLPMTLRYCVTNVTTTHRKNKLGCPICGIDDPWPTKFHNGRDFVR